MKTRLAGKELFEKSFLPRTPSSKTFEKRFLGELFCLGEQTKTEHHPYESS